MTISVELHRAFLARSEANATCGDAWKLTPCRVVEHLLESISSFPLL